MGSNNGFYFLDPRLTAEDYEKMAVETSTRNSEMLDRNGGDLDDCFVSSACHNLTIQVYQMLAALVRAGGKHPFTVLKTLAGETVKAKTVNTRYGLAWMLLDDQDQCAGFVTYKPARVATLAKRGYMEVLEDRPAAVRIIASGTGMAGLVGAYPVYVPDTRASEAKEGGNND